VLVWASGAIAWAPADHPRGDVDHRHGVPVRQARLLQATSCFWIGTLSRWNAFTYGSNYAGRYPMAIYRRWFQRFFTRSSRSR
jgi:ABC-2 type transport system permease protein